MFKRLLIIISVIVFANYGCVDTGTNSDQLDMPDSVQTKEQLEFDSEQIGEIIQNFSSPIEMAALIKDAGVEFNGRILAPTDNSDYYNTNFKRAIGLGMLGVDLGYLNIYEKTGPVVNYITIIKKLAEEMKVGHFFDFGTLKRLASNNSSVDSLMYMSTNSFNQMDSYLRDSDRSHLSALIVSGVWIEGLYLAGQVVSEKDNKEISDRIGEQKIILEDILLLLRHYSEDSSFAALIEDLENLSEAFKDVKISYTKGEPEAVEQDGMLIIIQNDRSHVEMTDQTLSNIISLSEQVRNNLIGIQ